MSGEFEKMAHYREAFSGKSFTELMLIYEVAIELLCKDKGFHEDMGGNSDSDYVLYGTLKRRLNTVMYETLHPHKLNRPSIAEFMKSIQGADGSHIR